jgi:pimeloyl-ACP methyl ester carboxylesterase
MEEIKHCFVKTNGIKLHYVTAGKGPLLILLHGFPEFWYTWRHQIPALAKHFQVVAPDLRGYNDSDKPPHVSDYKLSTVTQDIVGLIKALGHKKAHIVGHDWGGAVGWDMAVHHPEVIDHLVILNSPHPVNFARGMKKWKQLRKAWFMFYFQIPMIPEFFLKMSLKSTLRWMFQGVVTEKDINAYTKALEKPGALKAALNYYRATLRYRPKQAARTKISVPTLLIWGENDRALGIELTYGMEPLFSNSFAIEYIPHCGHFVNEQEPELVNRLLLDFLVKTQAQPRKATA